MSEYRTLSVPEVAEIISNADSALIVSHINPDGDTLGCSLAVRKMFQLMGKDAKIICPSKSPDYLDFMAGGESFEYVPGDENRYGINISLDIASPNQLGPLRNLKDSFTLMVDHHAKGEPYAANLIDPNAAAAGEIIEKVYSYLKEKGILPPCAYISRMLYTALSSDTGSFKYSNTTPETMMCAARLMAEINADDGMKSDEISRLLHDVVTKKDISIQNTIYRNMKLYENGALAVVIITSEMMKEGGFEETDLGGAVDVARKLDGVLVSVAIKQKTGSPDGYKISSRSNVDIDVSEICAKFDGGGHVRASGGHICAETPEKAFDIVTAAFAEPVRKYLSENKE